MIFWGVKVSPDTTHKVALDGSKVLHLTQVKKKRVRNYLLCLYILDFAKQTTFNCYLMNLL